MHRPWQLIHVASGLLVLLLVQTSLGQGRGKPPAGPIDVEPEDLRPGLLAVYRSRIDEKAILHRIDSKPAFHLGHSSPHPRIPPGPIDIAWTGIIFLKDPGPITFHAWLCGELTMEVDDAVVLQGKGESEAARIGPGPELKRSQGLYRLTIRYRSLADRPARLQIGWQGPGYSAEPLPPWQLMHLAAEVPRPVADDLRAEQGKRAAARFGCARCHSGTFPGVGNPPPGPALADLGQRVDRPWLLAWLDQPGKLRPDTHMPALFTPDRTGFVERWLIADHLLGSREPVRSDPTGDHRLGQRAFLSVGCIACHFIPDTPRAEQPDLDRFPLVGLADRFSADDLAGFLGNPHGRYPDGRMPRLPIPPDMARDLSAYLLLWSRPLLNPHSSGKEKKGSPPSQGVNREGTFQEPPTLQEIAEVARRLDVRGQAAAGAALVREKRCTVCHPGLGQCTPVDIPIADKSEIDGCLSGKTIPRFTMDDPTRKTILGYQRIARNEPYPSPFAARQQMLERAGCVRCHQRDTDRVPPLEALSSKLGGAYMQYVPFQRTPRLTYPHQKYLRSYLVTAVRESVSGLRPSRYSFRMPAFGHDAETLVQALAEADGELPATADPPPVAPSDPTLATLTGPHLVGFQGYACVSCHVWDGKLLSESDPGAIGTDLTRVKGRIRRDWFERFLEDPARSHPGTPMPGIFPKGKPAMLASILDGDPVRQKESLWSYFALGKNAPSPKPPPPLPVTVPARGEPPIVAQVPVRLPKGGSLESICILSPDHDLILYDLGTMTLHSGWTGANLLRGVHGRIRSFSVAGTMIGTGYRADPPWQLAGAEKPETPSATTLHGYDLLDDGASVRWRMEFPSVAIEVVESLRIATADGKRHLRRDLQFLGIPAGRSIELRCRELDSPAIDRAAKVMGEVKLSTDGGIYRATVTPSASGAASFVLQHILGRPGTPPPIERTILADPGRVEGSLERPGYRAIVYPRPKTAAGDNLIMPVSLAVHPRDGRVFVGSMKLGEIFVLRDPAGDGKQARFDNYARGLFQEAYSMLAEDDALYVLHRRNLTKITETGGAARRFDRIFAVPHGISESYDYGYGLVRDRSGAFVFSFAPYANTTLPGSGGALRLVPGKPPQEIAFGFRNPIGWSTGPEGEIFFTDNQGEWVATNKLCHLVEGRFYGFPNAAQRHHASKPMAKTAVWVPYAWARSINGVTYDHTSGKFGPFAGQFFLAELMYGGAIVRAQLEKVNGEYQGACFPFWGKGLLGPLVLAFDPKGPLYVGSITEPGWMAQPDRGALYRIDYTGQVPFEMQSIHVRPRGFRIVFTSPVSPGTAGNPASYQIEHYRYEYTGAYGSPELDRARLAIERVEVSGDGKSVELTTAPLTRNRVYMIEPRGVRSANGESLVHPVGAYTLNGIPVQ